MASTTWLAPSSPSSDGGIGWRRLQHPPAEHTTATVEHRHPQVGLGVVEPVEPFVDGSERILHDLLGLLPGVDQRVRETHHRLVLTLVQRLERHGFTVC